MILGALDDAGGQAYLMRQAEENPGPFLTLSARYCRRRFRVMPKSAEGISSGGVCDCRSEGAG